MNETEFVTIAILAKDKAHVLPYYLKLIEAQTYPAFKIKLYIRTNNNKDNTAEVLRAWVDEVKGRYSEVYFDATDVPDRVQDFDHHEWNATRFKVLGKIRQDSVEWAKMKRSHYFVADCDNFIVPETIERLLATNLPVIGPLLRVLENPNHLYSNYHFAIDSAGYYKACDSYFLILYQAIKGLIEVPVIHCCYLIRNSVLDAVCYDDASSRHEYVIFSDQLRKANIPQYIDNRYNYGKLCFATPEKGFNSDNITL